MGSKDADLVHLVWHLLGMFANVCMLVQLIYAEGTLAGAFNCLALYCVAIRSCEFSTSVHCIATESSQAEAQVAQSPSIMRCRILV